jgi:hypothetical protein
MTYFTTQFSKNQSEEPYQLFGNSLAPQTLSYVILNNLKFFLKKIPYEVFKKTLSLGMKTVIVKAAPSVK